MSTEEILGIVRMLTETTKGVLEDLMWQKWGEVKKHFNSKIFC